MSCPLPTTLWLRTALWPCTLSALPLPGTRSVVLRALRASFRKHTRTRSCAHGEAAGRRQQWSAGSSTSPPCLCCTQRPAGLGMWTCICAQYPLPSCPQAPVCAVLWPVMWCGAGHPALTGSVRKCLQSHFEFPQMAASPPPPRGAWGGPPNPVPRRPHFRGPLPS